jgi:arabinogalactan endo-1,4-beta-galactosidase
MKIVKKIALTIFLFCSLAGPLRASDYAIGADLSFLKQAEDGGTVFKDNGQAKPGLEIFKDHGYNWIRLRLFHAPTELPNNLEYTIAFAQAAKKLNFHFLLDYHYSDTWADPGKQFTPKAWENLSHLQLVKAVFDYTEQTIAAFREAGVLPGNWNNFADLVKAGIAGVEAGTGRGPRPRIMIHIDQGGNKIHTKEFFDRLNSYNVKYDVIGQSFYPWWQGSLNDLRENMIFMAEEYKKDIMVVEAAYNWMPAEYKQRAGPFPESPEGQKRFLEEVNRIVQETPNGLGKGIFWWEPAVTGHLVSRGFFDEHGDALPVMTTFDNYTRHWKKK